MASNTVPIRIRCPVELFKSISGLADKHGCSVSDMIRFSIKETIGKINDFELPNELQLMILKQEMKLTNSQLYIVKNMYKRIMDMAMANYFITRDINMKSINVVLDMYVKIFNLYPEKIKKVIRTDFKLTVKNLRNEEFVLGQSNTIRKLKMIENK